MLYVCSDITQFSKFREKFKNEHEVVTFLDLSNITSAILADECDSIVQHHMFCSVFLGYLEPGWMLEPSHQTRIRKLFRKFPVAFLCHFPESIPFSWKNEIEIFYTDNPLNNNGSSNVVNDGCSVQYKS